MRLFVCLNCNVNNRADDREIKNFYTGFNNNLYSFSELVMGI